MTRKPYTYQEVSNTESAGSLILLNDARYMFLGILFWSLRRSFVWINSKELGAFGLCTKNTIVYIIDENFDKYSFLQTSVHEVLHLLSRHLERLGDRNRELFNIAADHVVNETILEISNEPESLIKFNGSNRIYFPEIHEKHPHANVEFVYDLLLDNMRNKEFRLSVTEEEIDIVKNEDDNLFNNKNEDDNKNKTNKSDEKNNDTDENIENESDDDSDDNTPNDEENDLDDSPKDNSNDKNNESDKDDEEDDSDEKNDSDNESNNDEDYEEESDEENDTESDDDSDETIDENSDEYEKSDDSESDDNESEEENDEDTSSDNESDKEEDSESNKESTNNSNSNKPSNKKSTIKFLNYFDKDNKLKFKIPFEYDITNEDLVKMIEDEKEFYSKAQALWNSNSINKGSLSRAISEKLDDIFKVEIPWDTIVEDAILYLIQNSNRRSWSSPNIITRHIIRLPGEENMNLRPNILVSCIDCSGSVSTEDLKKFIGILLGCCEFFNKLIVLFHDTNMDTPIILDRLNEQVILDRCSNINQRGGTSHKEVFDYIEQLNGEELISMVVFQTDFYSDVNSIYKNYEWIKNIPIVWVLNSDVKVELEDVDSKVIKIN